MTHIVIERSLAGKEKTLVDAAYHYESVACVFDERVMEVLGERVHSALGSASKAVVLNHPIASVEQADALQAQTAGADALIAIGSGTVNDLCKFVAHRSGRPYAVFATAPSMNGYVSSTASLVPPQGGLKQSYAATPPTHLFADLEILAASPLRLRQSGLGDSLCRATAQTDWLLSHLLLGTPYDERPFRLLANLEHDLFAHAAGIRRGDLDAIEVLMRTLIASGDGMRMAGGSYPASQGEHMIAHTIDALRAEDHDNSEEPFHGEVIGVTTLTMAWLQSQLLSSDKRLAAGIPASLLPDAAPEPFRDDASQEAYARKYIRIEAQAAFIAEAWSAARKQLSDVSLHPEVLESVLHHAGSPITPGDIGLQPELYKQAVGSAYATRDRFTFLDMVHFIDAV